MDARNGDSRLPAAKEAEFDDHAEMRAELVELRQTLTNEHALRKLAVVSFEAASMLSATHARMSRALVNAIWAKCPDWQFREIMDLVGEFCRSDDPLPLPDSLRGRPIAENELRELLAAINIAVEPKPAGNPADSPAGPQSGIQPGPKAGPVEG